MIKRIDKGEKTQYASLEEENRILKLELAEIKMEPVNAGLFLTEIAGISAGGTTLTPPFNLSFSL